LRASHPLYNIAQVRPILIILTLPFTLVTLGLFLFVLNGLCLGLTASLVKGFEVHGLWAAVFGSLLVNVVSWLLTTAVSDRGPIVVITRWRGVNDPRSIIT